MVVYKLLVYFQELKYNKQVTDEATKQQLDRLNDLQEEIHAHSQTNTMLKNELEAWSVTLSCCVMPCVTFSRSNNADLMKVKAELEEEIEALKM